MDQFEEISDAYLVSLDISKTRLKNLPNYLFLCGGSTKRYKVEDEQLDRYVSMRGAIIDTIASYYPEQNQLVKYAEDYDDWAAHDTVKNLIDFELAIADMAGAIVLVLEGPGAFAELGSFSVLNSLADKLILVVNSKVIDENTFINYGPIKYLEDNEKVVIKYEWGVGYSVQGFERNRVKSQITMNCEDTLNLSKRITDRIIQEFNKISLKSPLLNIGKIGHVCFIVGDLIYTFNSLRIGEINNFLKKYFRVNSNLSLVRTCIYILEKFDFIKIVHSGDRYYIPTSNNEGFLKHYFDPELKELNNYQGQSLVKSELLRVLKDQNNDRYASFMEAK